MLTLADIDNEKLSEIRVFRILLKTAITDSISSLQTGGIVSKYEYNNYIPITKTFQKTTQSFGK